MKSNQIVTPSKQLSSALPAYIYENYETFVDFMQKSAEAEERVGFGQDILQNLQKYRNFDTYKNYITQFGVLKSTLPIDGDEIELEDGFGFPDENGVILIGDEVILYRTKEDNFLYGLQRGAAGTTVLPTLRSNGTYLKTSPEQHRALSQVTNLSSLFLVAMLDNIHKSFSPGIDASRVAPEINRSSLLQNIRDFFASKGSKLGIKALFKMLFAENDVEVNYPGDRMLSPSDSAWTENIIMRVVPFPIELTDPTKTYALPDKSISANLNVVDGRNGDIIGTAVVDFASAYPFESEVQYELYIDEDNLRGEFPTNPTSKLTRQLERIGTGNDQEDVFTVTVESTIGFPDSGVIYIGAEKISYTGKTMNQFVGCTRGVYGTDRIHGVDSLVFGPYYTSAEWTDEEGNHYISQSWPRALVYDVRVNDPGLLHRKTDEVYVNGPGVTDPREPSLRTFQENTSYALAQQAETVTMSSIMDRAWGPSGVYMDEKNIYVSSSNLPNYAVGPFSNDATVGQLLSGENAIHVIPRHEKRSENVTQIKKGHDAIGVFVDGVPAYSNVSTENVISGSICSVTVINEGSNYVTPTILVNDVPELSAILDKGKIIDIPVPSIGGTNYTAIPDVRATSGEGAVISLTFDNYGRVVTADVAHGGQYYYDVPTITVVDNTNRGKGALLGCEVANGQITTVNIAAHGIDYLPASTEVVVTPVGSGCVLEPVIQYWQKDRVYEINNTPGKTLDSGNAFLWPDKTNAYSKLGYACDPVILRQQLGDNEEEHSPIIGWAYDGNPIYGPYAYANGVDASDGIKKQFSGWVLADDRTGLIPAGGEKVATLPPDTATYPMGTFVEDYIFDPDNVIGGNGRILTEPTGPSPELGGIDTVDGLSIEAEDGTIIFTDGTGQPVPAQYIKTDQGDNYLNHQTAAPAVLDGFNGKVCNTPEFPKELYPDGVYCYFVTSYGTRPTYPYIMGPTFLSRPISQNITLIDDDGETSKPNNDQSSYDDTELTFDYQKINRFRNLQLTRTGQEVEIEIADVSTGSVSGVRVEDGSPDTSMVGDYCYFNNGNTGGNGAEARVSHVQGENILEGSGSPIATKLISHRQRINLSSVEGSFVFVEGSRVESSGGAIGVVENYDPTTKYLDVVVITETLFNFGDEITDNRGTKIIIPPSFSGGIINNDTTGGGSTYVSYQEPDANGDIPLTPGDLWWNADNGRLYIYFSDLDSSQWVTANPSGSRPLFGAVDEPLSYQGALTQDILSPQAENKVTIAEMAPSARTDGSPNQKGDMWWSSTTGMLYIWHGDRIVDYNQGSLPVSAEWVATDPIAAKNTKEGLPDVSQFNDLGLPPGNTYTGDVTVLISETAPLILPNGDALEPGTLWWSPISGRLYIFYTDANNSQWVATNTAHGSTQYSLDHIIDGDGGSNPEPISLLPEPEDATSLWFEDLTHFQVGDIIEFVMGAPGTDDLNDIAQIVRIVNNHNAIVDRGISPDPKELPHGTLTLNKSRALFRITTDVDHKLIPGDIILIEGSGLDIDTEHEVIEVGRIQPASGTATVDSGVVTGVTITDAGAFYPNNFYVSFYGGGGVGAYAYATVNSAGAVVSVTMVDGGTNYDSAPTPIFGSFETDRTIIIYTDTLYPDNLSITYSTRSTTIQSKVAYIEVTAGGFSYQQLPIIEGLYKRNMEDAVTKIDMVGTTIGSVSVVNGGRRYVNPIAIFTDITNNGSGAQADVTVEDGMVTAVTVTDPGSNYVEPFLRLVEADGKYIALTDDIGKIKSMKVTNPGRKVTADETIKPELQVQSRFVVSPTDDSLNNWTAGQPVFQGTPGLNLVTAQVVSYDPQRQVLFLEKIHGDIREGEIISNIFGTKATVILEGESDCEVMIGGKSGVLGKFIDDSSKVSSEYAVIQDSEYYQRFSYEIQSPMQQVQYETFVEDIVHPTGFAMFANVILNSTQPSGNKVEDVRIVIEDGAGPPVSVIGLNGSIYLNDLMGADGATNITVIALE